MIDINLKRRSFLISSAAGLSSLVFASQGLHRERSSGSIKPSSPLVLPQNFFPQFGLQWSQMEEQRFIFLEMKWAACWNSLGADCC